MMTGIDLPLIYSYGKESKVVNLHISWIVVSAADCRKRCDKQSKLK
jgi:hypothetical protein